MKKLIFLILCGVLFSTQGQTIKFTDSNLPIIIIKTRGLEIQKGDKITAHMKIINNDNGDRNHIKDKVKEYDGKISIKVRGSSSSRFPKKSYRLETQDNRGNNNNVSILGLPKENDWVLYAPYSDKTLMRNVITYELGRKIMKYSPRTRYCEVVINNEYMGVYVLTENIKIDKNRVDIQKTGGYIVKIDRASDGGVRDWYSPIAPTLGVPFKIGFVMHYPKSGNMTEKQMDYISNYITEFERVLNGPDFADPTLGYRKYINDSTFIDFLIMNEITKNLDGYRLSTFFYKNNEGIDNRLHMGPLWDFNLAFGNADHCEADLTTGWVYRINHVCGPMIPFWWERLMEDPKFKSDLTHRWIELRNGPLHIDSLNLMIDSLTLHLDESKDRNFQKWDILGEHVWPNKFVGNTYEEEIVYLKEWISTRVIWIDRNL